MDADAIQDEHRDSDFSEKSFAEMFACHWRVEWRGKTRNSTLFGESRPILNGKLPWEGNSFDCNCEKAVNFQEITDQ